MKPLSGDRKRKRDIRKGWFILDRKQSFGFKLKPGRAFTCTHMAQELFISQAAGSQTTYTEPQTHALLSF